MIDDRDRQLLLGRLARATEMHRWKCLSYCLLDSHLHLLVVTPEPNLGRGMKWFQGSYAQDFNHRRSRRGHVFGGRFYSRRIRRQEHLVAAVVYVALNPVRAGLVWRPEHWRWSSYAGTVGWAARPLSSTARKCSSSSPMSRLWLVNSSEGRWRSGSPRTSANDPGGQTRGV